MSVWYKIARNYTLPLAALVLVASVLGLVVSLGLLAYVAPTVNDQVISALGAWALWVTILGALGVLMGGWYVGEQVYLRRKFERLVGTDKRSEFVSSRKDLDDIAKRLPESYKPRIKEKEAQFVASKRS